MTRRLIQAALVLALTACGTSTETTAQPKDTSKRPFSVTEVATFGTPWAMAFLPGSGVPLTSMALVTEKTGRLWLVNVNSGAKQQVTGVPQVQVDSQGGLAEVVVHPDFAGNQRVYLSYSEPGPNGTSGAAIGYGRLVMGQNQPRLEGFRVIWRQQPKLIGGGHYSGRIAFAPDGTMFVSSGERQKMTPAQGLSGDLGKILHLTAEGQPISGGPWASRGGRAASYWTMGHRNVLGLAFAPDGRLWASEMGPRGGDEVNLIVRGRNYGWPEASYGTHYEGPDIPDNHKSRGFEEPKVWWNPSVSPGSLLIYTGELFPQWKGDALIGTLTGQALIRVDIDGDKARKADQWNMGNRIRAVDQGPRGEVYLLEDGRNGPGRLLRLEPAR